MPTYFIILTTVGLGKLAAAQASGIPLELAEMAAGDGSGAYHEPDAGQTTLVNEVWRDDVNRIYVHPNHASWIIAEAFIPASAGGFDIRETGVFDSDGDLIAVGKYPLTNKPAPGSGSEKDLYVRMILQVANTADVEQTTDPSLVLATKEYADTHDVRTVKAATTGAVVLSGTQTVDGVALVADERVLVKNQAASADNGIYLVKAGAWVRAYDADSALDVLPCMIVAVEQGTVNADSVWLLSTNSPIIIGTTALVFVRIYGKTGVAANTYKSVTVNDQGLVTAGSNPTTLAGFGITDAVAAADVVAVAAANKILKLNGDAKLPASITGDAGTVDGYNPDTGAIAGTIPVRDGNGKVPGSVTGDADTVDGKHAADLVLKDGGTMQADPTAALGVATKQYVDRLTLAQRVVVEETGYLSSGTVMPSVDDTIPQKTEGHEYLAVSITPSNAASLLRVTVLAWLTISSSSSLIGAIFRDDGADAVAAGVSGAGGYTPFYITYQVVAGSTAPTTFKFRAGASGSGTLYLNGNSAGRRLGGIQTSIMEVKEVLPAL